MLRFQFLRHVSKALFFTKIALKLGYFCKKMQHFPALGALPPAAGDFAPRPTVSGSWGLFPQTLNTAPPLRIFGYALDQKGLKIESFLQKTQDFFFCVFSETPSKVTNFNISHMSILSVESMSNNLASALLFLLCLFCARSSLLKIVLSNRNLTKKGLEIESFLQKTQEFFLRFFLRPRPKSQILTSHT